MGNKFGQCCQNRDFISGQKGLAKSYIVKSQLKSKILLKNFCRIDIG